MTKEEIQEHMRFVLSHSVNTFTAKCHKAIDLLGTLEEGDDDAVAADDSRTVLAFVSAMAALTVALANVRVQITVADAFEAALDAAREMASRVSIGVKAEGGGNE